MTKPTNKLMRPKMTEDEIYRYAEGINQDFAGFLATDVSQIILPLLSKMFDTVVVPERKVRAFDELGNIILGDELWPL